MEIFMDKIDHELYTAMYVDRDRSKAEAIWNKIKASKFVLKTASEIMAGKDGSLLMKSPLIGYLALKFPGEIDQTSYRRFVKRVLSNEFIANTIINLNGVLSESLLTLMLKNDDVDLEDYQCEYVIREAMKSSYKKSVQNVINYNAIPVSSEVVASINVNGLYVNMSKSEEAVFSLKLGKNVKREEVNQVYDLRYWLLKNHNFDLETKRFLAERLYPNLDEFKAVIDTVLEDLVKAYDVSVRPFDLLGMEDQEIKVLCDNGEELNKEVEFLKLLILLHNREMPIKLERQ